MQESQPKGTTILEAIKASLKKAGHYNSGDAVAPAAILWTDSDAEWLPLVKHLRPLMPELLILGAYEPEQKTGPAIWMRCVIEGTLPDVKMPEKAVPILYLPNVNRQLLRSPEDCPDELKPLVELQYRGVVWTQVNGKDWTIEAFLLSENGGLGLDIARDQKTRMAMIGALDVLAMTPVALLRGRKLEAEDFDKLMVGDTVRDLLSWISEPAHCKEEWDVARWSAFKSRCREEYDFDPDADGDIVAAEQLGLRQGVWAGAWRRFTESPALYPGIPAALRRAKPLKLIYDREPWPDENEKDEVSLRAALHDLRTLAPAEARKTILQLDKQHGERRQWVWARMGMSPLAIALEYLRTLAETTTTSLGGGTPDAMARDYTQGANRADDAVLRAMASVKSIADEDAVREAVRTLYLSWLDDTIRNFQIAVEKEPLPDSSLLRERLVTAEPGECILFVDGLRYDVAQRLLGKAHECQFTATEGYRWSALPSVTSTAKPAVTPVADAMVGAQPVPDFYPVFRDSQKAVNAERLRERLSGDGYQVLQGLDTGQPQQEDARGWSEFGKFDTLGHQLQSKLANQIDEQIELLLDRIRHLLDAGWRRVRVVTDHGWLLVPGGLPSIPLKKYLTECKWARCAVIKDGAKADVPTSVWFWNREQLVAFAPGVHCFLAGAEYAHGGLSLQECVTPDVTFSNPLQSKTITVTIESVQWLGLRCRVMIKPAAEGLFAELRGKPNDPKSRICAAKAFDGEGRTGLLVEDEMMAGMATSLVVFDTKGKILSKYPTIVGGES